VTPDPQARLTRLLEGRPGVRWSACLRDGAGRRLAAVGPERTLSTASIGKLLLLLEVARQYDAGTLDPGELLSRAPELAVADSGIWQHLQAERLSVDDLATLVGAASDNTATNVLLARVDLARVQATATALGLTRTRLLDRVRTQRRPADPPLLSTGSADELSRLAADLGAGVLVSTEVSRRLDRWLAPGMDLSMVAAPWHLDPLAHVEEDRGLVARNKTGTDADVRADVGYLRGPGGTVAYAVIANWDPEGRDARDEVLSAMHEVGRVVLACVR
jgi:beta-lactamase class A